MESTSIQLSSVEETMNFAQKIGTRLVGDEVIELLGDVGSGKTTFVKGLIQGVDSDDDVSSPTFTLENIYKGRVDVHHLDLYRLNEIGLLGSSMEEYFDQKQVVVIEWGGIAGRLLPKKRLKVKFEVTSEHARLLKIECPKVLQYLVEKNEHDTNS